PGHRLGQGRPGPGRRGGAALGLRLLRPEVLGLLAGVRGAVGGQRVRRQAGRPGGPAAGRRPPGPRRLPGPGDRRRGRRPVQGRGQGGQEGGRPGPGRRRGPQGRRAQGQLRRPHRGHRRAHRQPAVPGRAVRAVRGRGPGQGPGGGHEAGQRHRVRPDRRLLLPGPGRGRGLPGPDRGRGGVRQPQGQSHHRRLAGRAAVRGLEGVGLVRQGRRRALLRAAVHARAVPDGDRLTELAPAWLDPARPVPDLRTEVPGPEGRKVLARDAAVTSPSLPRAYAMVPRRGTGALVEDVDGNLFLALNPGTPVAPPAHPHPRVVEAVGRQAADLLHYSASDFYLPIYSEYAQALAATAPMGGPGRAFLTNSGTEAGEGGLKRAGAPPGRQYVISFYGAFHGRSYGSVSLTASKARYHAGFGPLLPGVLHAPYGYCHRCPLNLTFPECGHATVDWLEDTLFRYEVDPAEVAAIFVEPIQGEGGYIPPPPGWLAKLKALCRRHGILFVADEVQSGMGRTGRMWAIEHSGVEPDVLIAAKGIASGLPLGAFMARDELWRWPKGAHGSTYGGSPVPCAAGLATLAVLEEEGLLANATAMGRLLVEGL